MMRSAVTERETRMKGKKLKSCRTWRDRWPFREDNRIGPFDFNHSCAWISAIACGAWWQHNQPVLTPYQYSPSSRQWGLFVQSEVGCAVVRRHISIHARHWMLVDGFSCPVRSSASESTELGSLFLLVGCAFFIRIYPFPIFIYYRPSPSVSFCLSVCPLDVVSLLAWPRNWSRPKPLMSLGEYFTKN